MKKILLIISSIFISGNTFADQPKDWQLGFQNPASDGMRDIVNFHNNLLPVSYTHLTLPTIYSV